MRQLTCTSVRVDRWDYYISVSSKLDKRVTGVDRLKDAGLRAEPCRTHETDIMNISSINTKRYRLSIGSSAKSGLILE